MIEAILWGVLAGITFEVTRRIVIRLVGGKKQ